MLNIEHLRKQAKLYLRWHRERYYPVAARIRAVLPRYSRLTDCEILARPFQLSDAQELVARTVGFESWDALRRGTHYVTRTGTYAMPILTAAEPQLFVRDIAAASEFYTRKLGFSVAFIYGEPPFYAQVFRDGARLNFRQVDGAVLDAIRRATEQLLAATITLEDAKPLFVEYQQAGVELVQSLKSEPWGARTFMVRDPDGNLLLFAGRGE
jgi:catechol 2,3-dioxygenase-like lactoylglutathione lyase family enzyme